MTTREMSEVIQDLRRTVLLRDGSGLTDGQLLGCFLEQRDEAAFASLVRRHGPMVWGVCRRLLHQHDAEDAFQATFLVLVRKAATIVPRERVANWLYGVAHQTALQARRNATRRRVREKQVKQMPEPAVAQQDLWRDLQPVLDQELIRLPDAYREVIVLCELEGKTRKEVARQLSVPEGTVASRLARARGILAKRLARHGLAVSGGTLAAVLSEKAASASVPSSVVSSTIQNAGLVVAGVAATEVIPVKVATLSEGVMKAMLLTKCKAMILLVGTLSLILLGFATYDGLGQQPVKQNTAETAKPSAQTPASKDGGESAREEVDAHYCWLAFGPKGKFRVLMRLKGDEVAVDRDGDGKLEGKGERFPSEKDCKNIVIADPDGKTSYVITNVHVLHVVPPDKFVSVRVNIRGTAPSYPQDSIVKMARDPKDAPRAHFYGPLTVTPHGKRIVNRADLLVENDLVDVAGLLPQFVRDIAGKGLATADSLPKSLKRNEPTNLVAILATEGENSVVAVCSHGDTDAQRRDIAHAPFPRDVHPYVEVEFPPKQAGGQRIKKRFPLNQFCSHGIYGGPVQVPAAAGGGKARVTFSFDTWKGVKATSTSVEISVDEPQEERGEQPKSPAKDKSSSGGGVILNKGSKYQNADMDKLQGVWQMEALSSSREDVSGESLKGSSLEINGHKFVRMSGGKKFTEGLLAIARTGGHRVLVMISTDRESGVLWTLYDLKGDKLRLCEELVSEGFPGEFKVSNTQTVVTYKRVKADKQGKQGEGAKGRKSGTKASPSERGKESEGDRDAPKRNEETKQPTGPAAVQGPVTKFYAGGIHRIRGFEFRGM